MRIAIIGATGFIGHAVTMRLRRDGHSVVALVRDIDAAGQRLSGDIELAQWTLDPFDISRSIDGADAVVNLAGAPIFGKRWYAARKRVLVDSRVEVTRAIVDAIGRCDRKPTALVCASAVGIYGDRGDRVLTETSAPASDFLATLCADWESAADGASAHGVRTVKLRTGIALGRGGGALAKMLPLFSLGLGGRLGHGRQWMPWVHVDDVAEIVARAVSDGRFEGPINAVAPVPATNRQFTRALASALERPAFLPAPRFALRAVVGPAAQAMLASQRVTPLALSRLGFEFRFREVEAALLDCAQDDTTSIDRIAASDAVPDSPYLRERGARYLLRNDAILDAPLAEVFDFFSAAQNLAAITPTDMKFEITAGADAAMATGLEVDYRIALGPVPMKWRTLIERWQPGERFVDAQLRGPYRSWWHEHRFRALPDGRTEVSDRVFYKPPLGPLGWLAHRLFIANKLRGIFGYRTAVIRRRFGDGRAAPTAKTPGHRLVA